MITRGLGTSDLLLRGLGGIEIIIIRGGGSGRKIYFPSPYIFLPVFPQRSKAATIVINELKEKILETGVVKNTHEPYDSRYNKRYPVSEKQAARIAYSIAKEKGLHVGKYRGPNK